MNNWRYIYLGVVGNRGGLGGYGMVSRLGFLEGFYVVLEGRKGLIVGFCRKVDFS